MNNFEKTLHTLSESTANNMMEVSYRAIKIAQKKLANGSAVIHIEPNAKVKKYGKDQVRVEAYVYIDVDDIQNKFFDEYED